MTEYRFQVIEHRVQKSLPCPACRRKVRRSTTFTQTLNPFNRNEGGGPKSLAEIRAELGAQAAAWQQEPVEHPACAAGGAE